MAIFGALAAMSVIAACGSGPSPDALLKNEPPVTTTTTVPPPEGVTVVRIDAASFSPANLKLDLDMLWIVEWRNEDEREYVIETRKDEFVSPPLAQGDTFQFDFSTVEPGLYRYYMFVGQQRVPGIVDTRPEQ